MLVKASAMIGLLYPGFQGEITLTYYTGILSDHMAGGEGGSPMVCFVVDLQTYNCQTLCVVGRFCSYREYFHKYEIGSMQSSS